MAKKEILNNSVATLRVAEPVGEVIEGVEAVADTFLEAVEDAGHALAEVPEYLEQKAQVVETVVKSNPFVIAGVAVVALGVGGYVGYLVGVKRTTTRYEQILEEQVAEAKAYYARVNKAEEFATVEQAAATLVAPYAAPDVPEQSLNDRLQVQESLETVESNVFAETRRNTPAWDIDTEIALRQDNPDRPYVISEEEYSEGDGEFHSLYYYVKDDTLADEQQKIIPETDSVVGDDNLLRFGEGSGNKDIVYIHNPRTGSWYEVIKSMKSYKKDVLGMRDDDEGGSLRHSSRNRMRWSEE